MPIRVSNLRLPIEEPEGALRAHLARILGVDENSIRSWRLLRKSLDLRDKQALGFVYSAEVWVPDDEAAIVAHAAGRSPAQVEVYEDHPFQMPRSGMLPLRHRPVVIGSGPGGLVAAFFLAEQGYQPLVLERGTPVNER